MTKKSWTKKTSGMVGVKPHYYKTTIDGEGTRRSGVGKTPEQAGERAKANYEKARKK